MEGIISLSTAIQLTLLVEERVEGPTADQGEITMGGRELRAQAGRIEHPVSVQRTTQLCFVQLLAAVVLSLVTSLD